MWPWTSGGPLPRSAASFCAVGRCVPMRPGHHASVYMCQNAPVPRASQQHARCAHRDGRLGCAATSEVQHSCQAHVAAISVRRCPWRHHAMRRSYCTLQHRSAASPLPTSQKHCPTQPAARSSMPLRRSSRAPASRMAALNRSARAACASLLPCSSSSSGVEQGLPAPPLPPTQRRRSRRRGQVASQAQRPRQERQR